MAAPSDDSATVEARLARVEAAISSHRWLRMRATWAGHDGEALWHEGEVDRLLDLWQRVRHGRPYTLTELDARPAAVGTVTEGRQA